MSFDGNAQAEQKDTVATSVVNVSAPLLAEEIETSASVPCDHLTGATTALLQTSMETETSEAGTTGTTMLQPQDTSQLLQASLPSLSSSSTPAKQPVISAIVSTQEPGTELAEDTQVTTTALSTSTIVSPPLIASDAAPATAFLPSASVPSQQQLQNPQSTLSASTGSIPMKDSSNPALALTSPPSVSSATASSAISPIYQSNSQQFAGQIDTATAVAINAHIISQQQQQQQQQQLLNGDFLAQQAAFVADVNSSTQLNAAIAQQQQQQQATASSVPVHTMAMQYTNHSRSTSVVDGMVAMFPNDASTTVTPRSGLIVPNMASSATQPIATQLQLQLQQHQLEQKLANGHNVASNNSTLASASHSGVPSPYATPSIAACANGAASVGHRRQLSNTFPAALHQQQQQQHQMMLVDTPVSMTTAPSTLVPGTPTTFGQLQFSAQSSGASSAVPLQQQQHHHHHHSHLGHSRHLSLDTANFRLMTADASSLHTLPLHGLIHEHPATTAQNMQFGAASNPLLALQQQQAHLQQQLQQQQQQIQAQMNALSQQKASAVTTRTVPATPQTPMGQNSFAATLQAPSLADSLLQHHQNQHHRGMFMHHSSASVDLGSLSSAFNVAQFNQTLSGQISPASVQAAMAPAIAMSQLHLPQQLSSAGGIVPQSAVQAGSSSTSGVEMACVDALEDEDEDDEDNDEENSGEDAENDTRATKRAKTNGKGSGGKPKRPVAPYKRFRNSFIFFANERRKQWKREHPEVSKIQNRGFIQDMSKVWNSMTAKEKAPYMKMAEDDKLRYEADVKKYGPLLTSTPSASSSAASLAPGTTPATSSAVPATTGVSDNSSSGDGDLDETQTVSPAKSKTTSGSSSAAVLAQANVSLAPSFPSIVPTALPQAEKSVDKTASSVVSVTSATEPALENTINNAAAVAAAAIVQPTPIAPAFVGINHASIEPFNIDTALLSQQAYQALLSQTFGQDFSPQAIEFDPSCFVGPDVQSTDASSVCFNPAILAAPAPEGMQQQQYSAFDDSGNGNAANGSNSASNNSLTSGSGGGSSSGGNGNGKSASASGPPITTLVGTKRKSSSDGQPMTSLPMSIKRFRNSFIYYVNERRREIQFKEDGTPTNVEVNNREFLKEMSAKWRTMTDKEKAPYLEMADKDKERFTRQMREYELEHPDEFNKIGSRHRRRRSSTSANNPANGSDTAVSESGKPPLVPSTNTSSIPTPVSGVATAVSCGLNISMVGTGSGTGSPNGMLSLPQNIASVNGATSIAPVPADAFAQELNRAIAATATTPISTAMSTPLTTPLLTPNMASDKADLTQLATGHLPSLPSVPEEMVICTEAATNVASNSSVAGSTYLLATPIAMSEVLVSGAGSSYPAGLTTLPTVLEGAEEDVHMN
ncbi:hypothetical protein GGI25_006277 [Coemansia spiralis]|uniref:HMG box domain-containing protein n=1 Tax=Coemansia spiralis TaxID=417178 RepID=A0A9W8FX63_9FUNG|nr:hypothetical protein GGI25_006277 [Coemansia spiralis]